MRDGFMIDRHSSCYLPSLYWLANDHGCHPCIFMYFLNIAYKNTIICIKTHICLRLIRCLFCKKTTCINYDGKTNYWLSSGFLGGYNFHFYIAPISNSEDFVQLNPWDASSALLVNIFFLHKFYLMFNS